MPTLVFDLEDGSEISVPLTEHMTLGSAEGNDILVDDPDIEASHAEIYLAEGMGYWVRDLGSRTGTYVRGQRVEACGLQPGDMVTFGPITGRFLQSVPEAEQPRPAVHPARNITAKVPLMPLPVMPPAKTAELMHTQATVETLRREILELETRKQASQAEYEHWLAQRNDDRDRDQLSQEIRKLREERDALAAETAPLRAECATLRAEKEELTLKAEALREEISVLEQKQAANVMELHGRLQQMETANAQVETLAQRHEELTTNLAGLQNVSAELEEAREQHSDLTARVDEAREELRILQDQQEDALKALDLLQAESARTSSALEQQQRELDTVKPQLQDGDRRLHHMMEEIRTAATNLHDLESRQQHLHELEGKLQELQDTLVAADQRRSRLEEEHRTIEATRSVLQESVSSLGREEEALKSRLRELKARQEEEATSADTVQQSIQRHEARLRELQGQSEDSEQRTAEEHARLQAILKNVRLQITYAEAKLSPLRHWHEELDQRYARLATLKPDSPEAQAEWADIQQHRKDILDQVTASPSIMARPSSRPQVVPRGK